MPRYQTLQSYGRKGRRGRKYTAGDYDRMPTQSAQLYRTIRPKKLAMRMSRNIHSFKRITSGGNINSNSAADVLGSMTFDISSVPGSADFTNLYDQYRINAVKVTFRPQTQSPAYSASAFWGAFYTTLDFDDDTTISQTDIRQTRYCRQHNINSNRPFHRYFKPRVLNEIYRSAVTTAYTVRTGKNPFIDLAYNDVPHYALKYVWTQSGTSDVLIIVDTTYYFQMKNPR